jgi:hypothetical protein
MKLWSGYTTGRIWNQIERTTVGDDEAEDKQNKERTECNWMTDDGSLPRRRVFGGGGGNVVVTSGLEIFH